MCCTFGDVTDVAWWRKDDLPLIVAIDRDGRLTEAASPYTGLPIPEARRQFERAKEIGSLEVGKLADIVLFDAPNHRTFSYHYGINLAEKVFKRGVLVAERGRRVCERLGIGEGHVSLTDDAGLVIAFAVVEKA